MDRRSAGCHVTEWLIRENMDSTTLLLLMFSSLSSFPSWKTINLRNMRNMYIVLFSIYFAAQRPLHCIGRLSSVQLVHLYPLMHCIHSAAGKTNFSICNTTIGCLGFLSHVRKYSVVHSLCRFVARQSFLLQTSLTYNRSRRRRRRRSLCMVVGGAHGAEWTTLKCRPRPLTKPKQRRNKRTCTIQYLTI